MICISVIGIANGQAIVKYNKDYDTDKAIVRFWQDDISIAYIHTSGNDGYFIYERVGSSIYSATAFPAGEVTDFEILGDSMYLCGVSQMLGVGDYGFDGKFDINDLFFYAGGYTYCVIDKTLTNCCARMSAPRRMDIYELGGIVHYALAGDMSPEDWGGYSSPVAPLQLFQINDDTPVGEILVEDLGNDIFAAAYYYQSPTEAGLTVKILTVSSYTPYLSVINSYKIIQTTGTTVSTSWKLRDLRYNSNLNRLYLLQDMDYLVDNNTNCTV